MNLKDLVNEIDKHPEKNNKVYQKMVAKEVEKHLSEFKKIDQPLHNYNPNNQIIVIGLPQTVKAKVDSLINVLKTKVLKALKLDTFLTDIQLEIGEDDQTTGIAVMTFDSEDKANQAAESLDRFQFTKYTLTSVTASKFDEIFNLKKEEIKPNYLKNSQLDKWKDPLGTKI